MGASYRCSTCSLHLSVLFLTCIHWLWIWQRCNSYLRQSCLLYLKSHYLQEKRRKQTRQRNLQRKRKKHQLLSHSLWLHEANSHKLCTSALCVLTGDATIHEEWSKVKRPLDIANRIVVDMNESYCEFLVPLGQPLLFDFQSPCSL